jgi:hypothetical protein
LQSAPFSPKLLVILLLFIGFAGLCPAQSSEDDVIKSVIVNKTLRIPRVKRPPNLEDFIDMRPSPEFANGGMVMVSDLKQRLPNDGASISQRTEIYLGYDQKHLYAAMIAFASDPKKIRAHMSRREDIWNDDVFLLILDTFNDRRRAYGFGCNPLGIQTEGVWTEGGGWDFSWDTLWSSEGRLTPEGYVILMSIPFRSLRFPARAVQEWGIMLDRDIPSNDEQSFWPQYTTKVDGRLNQEGTMQGVENVSPGRNMQFIPYVAARSYRAPDYRDMTNPVFERKTLKGDAGLDSKIILKDSLVLDSTINPDFAQVESDDPQVTANRRFEVYYPELRPFFVENAGFFQTPIDLVFTRRIANPTYGVRLTGKTGPYAIGILSADDRAPGLSVPNDNVLSGTKAYFNIVRVNRDVWKQSTIGLIYTDREYQGSYNRIGGIDTRLKFNDHWIWTAQGVVSSNYETNRTSPAGLGYYSAGPTFYSSLQRNGRKFNFAANYNDTSTGFVTHAGFFRRPDYRLLNSYAEITWHPKTGPIYSHGPTFGTVQSFDHQTGTHLYKSVSAIYDIAFRGLTSVEVGASGTTETLRPLDFASLPQNRQYSEPAYWVFIGSDKFQKVNFRLQYQRSKAINFTVPGAYDLPPLGTEPNPAWDDSASFELTLRPMQQLRIDNSYTWERLCDHIAEQSVFNNHILRTKANYQITRALSLRFIETYETLLTNPRQSSLKTTKGFNTDFLVTYLLHPGTAVYVGYNSDFTNLTRNLALDPVDLQQGVYDLQRTRNTFINDERQFFIKISYLFRF